MYDQCMKAKERLSASVDRELLAAAEEAVKSGRAESVSGWVNEALHRQLDHDRRMSALGEFIAAHEAQFGEITEEEMHQARRRMRSRAIPVRGGRSSKETSRGKQRRA
jgi:Arc/MetJ-type ribon-helix-helix transcriptional regulator